jgi:hypothetical protein
MGGETAHHKTNINMAMKLENSDLASNTKENMSIFGMHFHKVLNNHKPVDNSVLNLIEQKPYLTAINAPITFKEVKCAINKLKKGKAAIGCWAYQAKKEEADRINVVLFVTKN